MSVATIKRKVQEAGGWLRLFNAVAPELDEALAAHLRRATDHVACPVHGGRHGDGFRLFPDADATGGSVCNSCGLHSDGIATLSWLWRCSTTEVLRRLGEALDGGMRGLVRRSRAAPGLRAAAVPVAASSTIEDARARRAVYGLYAAGLPLAHPAATLGRAYLRSRGLDPRRIGAEADLRFHPAVHAYDKAGTFLGTHPGLLAGFRAPDGALVTLQRTYL